MTLVGGPDIIGQALRFRMIDELHMDIRAILLGDGLRMFPGLQNSPIGLELIDTSQSPGITHLRYRVQRA